MYPYVLWHTRRTFLDFEEGDSLRGFLRTQSWRLQATACLVAASALLPGCLTPGATTATNATTTGRVSGTTLTYPTGARAVKIVFADGSAGHATTGSFDSPTAGGGSLDAVRLYTTNDALLANGRTSSSWPKWLSGVTVGISGASNTAATHADCARFGAAGEDTASKCDFNGDGVHEANCGGPANYYRVSEYDCAAGGITTGVGNSSDGVFIRVTFNRDSANLATHENIMVLMDYTASSLNGPPADPTNCLTAGVFDPTNPNCADHTWQMFLLTKGTDTYSPFVTVAPPSFGWVNTTTGTGGGIRMTRQFILPLSGSTATTIMQLSRMKGLAVGATNYSRCIDTTNTPTGSANSPLCNGMIFYSMTLFRL